MSIIRLGVGSIAAGNERSDLLRRARQVLGVTLRRPVELVVFAGYADLIGSLDRHDLELAWLPPALCVRALDRGVTLLLGCVRAGAKRYHGVLFVAPRSARQTPEDLAGAHVAWVDPESSSGYLFPRAALRARGLEPDELFGDQRMLGSHGAVIDAVANGSADCGATYFEAGPEAATQAGWTRTAAATAMRTVLLSAPIPSDAVCAGAHVGAALREELGTALAALHTNPDGALLLQELFEVTRLEPALPRHYDCVREALGLPPISLRKPGMRS